MTVDYLKIVQLAKEGFSLNRIAKTCDCKWETVQRTIGKCTEAWGSLGQMPDGITSADIDWMINSRSSSDDGYLQPDCDEVLARCRKGEKRNELWAEYAVKAEVHDKKAYQLSRFNEIVSDYAKQHNIIVSLYKLPGQECQIDWVGDKATIIDYDTKEPVHLHLFVMVLPYSSYFYVEAFPDEKMQSWLLGHKHAFEFFGGVPTVAVPDNCATATDEARRKYFDTVILNKRYENFMDHYGIVVAPARVRKPKDKPTVEATVRIVEDDLMRPLAKEKIGSIAEYNRALHNLLADRLAKDFTKKIGSRTSIFTSEEKDKLHPLPAFDFTTAKEQEAMVGRDYRIQYGYAFYTVPCEYINTKVIVRDENSVIRIYNRRRELIAVHDKATHKWQRVSNPDHEPKNIAKFMGTTPDALIFRASKIGENLVGWVKATLDSSTTRSDMFRTVDSVLRFAATADKDDMEEAAQKAVKLRVVTVKGFKSLYNNIHDGKSHVSDNGDGSLPLFNFKPIYLDENADGEVKR